MISTKETNQFVPSNQCEDGGDTGVLRGYTGRSSFVSCGESVLTSPTHSLSDLSGIKSSAFSDRSRATNHQQPTMDRVSTCAALPKHQEDLAVRATSKGNKADRNSLVGMIAKVMTSSSALGEEDSDTENDELDSNALIVQQSLRRSRHDSRPSNTKQHNNAPGTLPSELSSAEDRRDHAYGFRSALMPTNEARRRAVPRTASASTAAEQEQSPMKRLPKRSVSLRASLSKTSPDRDLVPCMPPRRESFDEKTLPVLPEEALHSGIVVTPDSAQLDSSRATSHSNSTRSSSGTSGTPSLSGDQIQSYVMSRIPKFVQEHLAEEEWKRVFSAAAEAAGMNTTISTCWKAPMSPETELGVHEEKQSGSQYSDEHDFDADDASTVVSALTSPSMIGQEESDRDFRCSTKKATRKMVEVVKDTSPLPSRSWHEGSSTNNSAPRIPARFDFAPSSRRMSAPTSPTPKVFREQQRRNTLDSMKPPKNVTFSVVRVRYYERILEVNPCTSSGPSVGIGWHYKQMKPIDLTLIQEKETNARHLLLSRHEREKMLFHLGYKSLDIARAVRETLKLKNQRAQTYNNIKHERVEYLIEKSKRKVGKLLGFGAGKRPPFTLHNQDGQEALACPPPEQF